ncbi:MAG: amidophosphoribosyltransferase [Candidatus Altiarchaeota archaeon]|nr:amidophosphoribosyltransferase [Candidatus Altiarchaeota archaeon]
MSGLFGVVCRGDCSSSLFLGTDYHSHLGTQYGGLAVYSGDSIKKKIHDISRSQFKSKFFDDIQLMKGNSGIGVISNKYAQPLVFQSQLGSFAICTDGLIENEDELIAELISDGIFFNELSNGSTNATELVARLICQKDSIVEGIAYMFKKIEGSISLLLLNKEGVYAARDRHGHSSLVVGIGEDKCAVASESCSFPNLGLDSVKFLGPGEVVLLKSDSFESLKSNGELNRVCAFLWIYTGFPASSYEGKNVEFVRERCGMAIAEKDDVEADMVAGVPDSGTAHAVGYAMTSGIPYRRPLVKYTPGYGRSYIPPSQEIRDQVAFMKLIPSVDLIRDKRIVLCEDSIVRGTQLRNYTLKKLFDAGAKEVHVRPACPPLLFPCKFNISTRTRDELIARRAIKSLEGRDLEDISEYLDPSSEKYGKMVEWIREDIGATSLRYISVEDMVEAIGLPRNELCLYCWTGRFH